MLAGIARAKTSVIIETYIFKLDSVGLKVIAALSLAAKRGLEVRVLMDGIGSADDGKTIAHQLEKAGVTTKIYHPLPWQVSHYRRAIRRDSLLGQCLFFFQKINQRDHRKLCVVDSETLWTGSLNITSDHLSVEKGGAGWRDLGIKMSDATVTQAEDSFNRLWDTQNQHSKRQRYRNILSNLTPRSQRKKAHFITQKIRKAQHRIWLTSAYFAPGSSLVQALKQAAKQGLEVHLILPRESDVKIFPFLTSTYYPELIQAGIKIHEYKPGFLHAKALIIDHTFLLGSTNFNHRSFIHDLELDVFVTQHTAQQTLESLFIQDMSQSELIASGRAEKNLIRRSLGAATKLLQYWF
jgi:cardiolipin synthase